MNIYLKLPEMVACFIRNSLRTPLAKSEPLKLSPVTLEGHLLRRGLRSTDRRYENIGTNVQRKPPLFYTHDEWVLLRCGTNTRTLKTTVYRNPESYPTYQEIRCIEGYPVGQRSDNYDYLCIQLPRTRFDGEKERPINLDNPVYLTDYYAHSLISCLIDQFDLALAQWEVENKMYCFRKYDEDKVLVRRRTDIIYRFCERYDIPIGKSEVELAALRKKLSRILDANRKLRNDDTAFDITYTDSRETAIQLK